MFRSFRNGCLTYLSAYLGSGSASIGDSFSKSSDPASDSVNFQNKRNHNKKHNRSASVPARNRIAADIMPKVILKSVSKSISRGISKGITESGFKRRVWGSSNNLKQTVSNDIVAVDETGHAFFYPLERRVMLDAEGVIEAAGAVFDQITDKESITAVSFEDDKSAMAGILGNSQNSDSELEESKDGKTDETESGQGDSQENEAVQSVNDPAIIEDDYQATGKSIFLIDTSLEYQDQFLSSISEDSLKIMIDKDMDLSEVISKVGSYGVSFDQVYILSHGSEGYLKLGSTPIDFQKLTAKQKSQLTKLKKNITKDGDILIYGCNFGAGDIGRSAVATLARLTGADIAASDDLTGGRSLKGDWDLEVRQGAIGDNDDFDQDNLIDYQATLAPGNRVLLSVDESGNKAMTTANLKLKFYGAGTSDQAYFFTEQHNSGFERNNGQRISRSGVFTDDNTGGNNRGIKLFSGTNDGSSGVLLDKETYRLNNEKLEIIFQVDFGSRIYSRMFSIGAVTSDADMNNMIWGVKGKQGGMIAAMNPFARRNEFRENSGSSYINIHDVSRRHLFSFAMTSNGAWWSNGQDGDNNLQSLRQGGKMLPMIRDMNVNNNPFSSTFKGTSVASGFMGLSYHYGRIASDNNNGIKNPSGEIAIKNLSEAHNKFYRLLLFESGGFIKMKVEMGDNRQNINTHVYEEEISYAKSGSGQENYGRGATYEDYNSFKIFLNAGGTNGSVWLRHYEVNSIKYNTAPEFTSDVRSDADKFDATFQIGGEYSTTKHGRLVKELIRGSYSDVDEGDQDENAMGIAITQFNQTKFRLHYYDPSIGSGWHVLEKLDSGKYLLLGPNARFALVPRPGTLSPTLTSFDQAMKFRLWDQHYGTKPGLVEPKDIKWPANSDNVDLGTYSSKNGNDTNNEESFVKAIFEDKDINYNTAPIQNSVTAQYKASSEPDSAWRDIPTVGGVKAINSNGYSQGRGDIQFRYILVFSNEVNIDKNIKALLTMLNLPAGYTISNDKNEEYAQTWTLTSDSFAPENIDNNIQLQYKDEEPNEKGIEGITDKSGSKLDQPTDFGSFKVDITPPEILLKNTINSIEEEQDVEITLADIELIDAGGESVRYNATYVDKDGKVVSLTGAQLSVINDKLVLNKKFDYEQMDVNKRVTITLSLTDDVGNETTATHTLSIDNKVEGTPPTQDQAGAVKISEDKSYTFQFDDLHLSDINEDQSAGDISKITILTLPTKEQGTLTWRGVAVQIGDSIDKTDLRFLVFTPSANYNGPAKITFTATDRDGNDSDSANPFVLNITVDPVEDDPKAERASANVGIGEFINFNNEGTFDGYSDPDAGDENFTKLRLTIPKSDLGDFYYNGVKIGPSDLDSNGHYFINYQDIAKLTFKGEVKGALNVKFVYYDSTDNQSIEETLVITISDDQNPPTANDITETYTEDTNYPFQASDFSDVYSDLDGDAFDKVIIKSLPSPSEGELILGGKNVQIGQEISVADIGNLQFVPAPNYDQDVTFDFSVKNNRDIESSASYKFTLKANAIDEAPIASDITKTVEEDGEIKFSLSDFQVSDTDTGDDKLEKIEINTDSAEGKFVLRDPTTGTDTPLSGLMTITRDQIANLFYIPNKNVNGDVTFKYKAYTNLDPTSVPSADANINIKVTSVDDNPTLKDIAVTTPQDTDASIPQTAFEGSNFSDGDGDTFAEFRITGISNTGLGGLYLGNKMLKDGDTVNAADIASLVFKPATSQSGIQEIKFKVIDSAGHEADKETTLKITVSDTADIPTVEDQAYTMDEKASYTFKASDLNYNDNDPGDDLDKIVLSRNPDPDTEGFFSYDGKTEVTTTTFSVDEFNKLMFVAAKTLSQKTITFAYTVTNTNNETSDSKDIVFTVDPIQDAPVLNDFTVRGEQDKPLAISKTDFEDNFEDEDDDSLESFTITGMTNPDLGALWDTKGNADDADDEEIKVGAIVTKLQLANLVFKPKQSAWGEQIIKLRVVDSAGTVADNETEIKITIADAADPPEATDQTYKLNEHESHTFKDSDLGYSDVDNTNDPTKDQLKEIVFASGPTSDQGYFTLAGVKTTKTTFTLAEFNTLKFVAAATIDPKTFTLQYKVVNSSNQSSKNYEMEFEIHGIEEKPTAEVFAANADKSIRETMAENDTYTFKAADFNYDDLENDKIAGLVVDDIVGDSNAKLFYDGIEYNKGDTITITDLNDFSKLEIRGVQDQNGAYTLEFRLVSEKNRLATDNDTISEKYTFSLAISNVNTKPTSKDGSVDATEDTEYVFKPADFDFQDSDAEDKKEDATIIVDTQPTKGNFVYVDSTGNKTTLTIDPSTPYEVSMEDILASRFRYEPARDDNNKFGETTFRFRVKGKDNGQGEALTLSADDYEMTIDIAPIDNDKPVGNNFAKNILEDTTYTFDPTTFEQNIMDPDIIAPDTPNLNRIKFKFAANTDQSVKDGLTLNGQPVVEDQYYTAAELADMRFTGGANFYGNVELIYTVETAANAQDNDTTEERTFTIIVQNQSDISETKDNTVGPVDESKNYTFTPSDFPFIDQDATDSLGYVFIDSIPDPNTEGSLMYGGKAVTAGTKLKVSGGDFDGGDLVFIPFDPDYAEDPTFQFHVANQDGDESNTTATLTIDYLDEPDNPTSEDTTITVAEDTPYKDFKIGDGSMGESFVYKDVDPNDQASNIQITELPTDALGNSAGKLYLNFGTPNQIEIAKGALIAITDIPNLTFIPEDNFATDASFKFKIIGVKAGEESLEHKVNITFTEQSDPPVTPADQTINVQSHLDHKFTQQFFENLFDDPDGDSLEEIVIKALPQSTNGTLYLFDPSTNSKTAVAVNQRISLARLGDLIFEPANPNVDETITYRIALVDSSGGAINGQESGEFEINFEVSTDPNRPVTKDVEVITPSNRDYQILPSFFSYFDADGDELTGIVLTKLPDRGKLLYDGAEVTQDMIDAGFEVAKADIDKLVYIPYKTDDPQKEDYSLQKVAISFKSKNDRNALSDEKNINIDIVEPINTKPEAIVKPGTPLFDDGITGVGDPLRDWDVQSRIDDYFSDPDGDKLTITDITGLPPSLSFVDGEIKGTPTRADAGLYKVVVKVADKYGGEAEQVFDVYVADAVHTLPGGLRNNLIITKEMIKALGIDDKIGDSSKADEVFLTGFLGRDGADENLTIFDRSKNLTKAAREAIANGEKYKITLKKIVIKPGSDYAIVEFVITQGNVNLGQRGVLIIRGLSVSRPFIPAAGLENERLQASSQDGRYSLKSTDNQNSSSNSSRAYLTNAIHRYKLANLESASNFGLPADPDLIDLHYNPYSKGYQPERQLDYFNYGFSQYDAIRGGRSGLSGSLPNSLRTNYFNTAPLFSKRFSSTQDPQIGTLEASLRRQESQLTRLENILNELRYVYSDPAKNSVDYIARLLEVNPNEGLASKYTTDDLRNTLSKIIRYDQNPVDKFVSAPLRIKGGDQSSNALPGPVETGGDLKKILQSGGSPALPAIDYFFPQIGFKFNGPSFDQPFSQNDNQPENLEVNPAQEAQQVDQDEAQPFQQNFDTEDERTRFLRQIIEIINGERQLESSDGTNLDAGRQEYQNLTSPNPRVNSQPSAEDLRRVLR